MSRRGAALVEVVISTLLLAATVAGVFAALLTATVSSKGVSEKELAAEHVERLLEELRNFVAEDRAVGPSAPGEDLGAGPTWRLQGDACGCWALEAGEHDVTARLPASLRGMGGRMVYTVEVVTLNGEALRRVRARVDWTPVE